jgi:mediator of RNA polymerase II transcription subunit 12, fungi type
MLTIKQLQLTPVRLEALLRLALVHGPSLVLKANNQQQAALMWTLRTLIANPGLEAFPATVRYLFDVTALLSDHLPDDVRKQLARLDVVKAIDDVRGAFIFGSVPPPDGWLSLMTPANTPSSSQPGSSPQTQSPSMNSAQSPHLGYQQSHPSATQRSFSQPQLQQQMQPQTPSRAYSPYQQPHKMFPQQLQRMASGSGQPTQLQQLQQMQQMQAMAHQRGAQPSPTQQQRAAGAVNQTQMTGRGGIPAQDKVEMKTVPFALSRWEILPDSGGNPAGNETAISLSLFGARRV